MVDCIRCKTNKAIMFSDDMVPILCKKCYKKTWSAEHNEYPDKTCDNCERILINYPKWKTKCLTCFILEN